MIEGKLREFQFICQMRDIVIIYISNYMNLFYEYICCCINTAKPDTRSSGSVDGVTVELWAFSGPLRGSKIKLVPVLIEK